ncbi:hypothetical protein OnM2_096041 [Erysiphe neolycopersici]|uniref:Uncharacterized protein n=1 Tax=Erysiphe neolycopersici TaxID=212602 RepID=A0A420HAX4_9PEZI|nr:hypothetical protein OnM2_096041 [Erysiphe neolycopersici]
MLRLQSYRLRTTTTTKILSPGVSCTFHKPFYCHQVQYTTPTPKESDFPPSSKSPHVEFYKFFGRPIAKVLLMSACTYQLAYLLWVNEETKERKADKVGE